MAAPTSAGFDVFIRIYRDDALCFPSLSSPSSPFQVQDTFVRLHTLLAVNVDAVR